MGALVAVVEGAHHEHIHPLHQRCSSLQQPHPARRSVDPISCAAAQLAAGEQPVELQAALSCCLPIQQAASLTADCRPSPGLSQLEQQRGDEALQAGVWQGPRHGRLVGHMHQRAQRVARWPAAAAPLVLDARIQRGLLHCILKRLHRSSVISSLHCSCCAHTSVKPAEVLQLMFTTSRLFRPCLAFPAHAAVIPACAALQSLYKTPMACFAGVPVMRVGKIGRVDRGEV